MIKARTQYMQQTFLPCALSLLLEQCSAQQNEWVGFTKLLLQFWGIILSEFQEFITWIIEMIWWDINFMPLSYI